MQGNASGGFGLAGRTVLITGGTQGVGGAIAVAAAAAGADLVLQGLREDAAAEETVRRCREKGVEVELLTADLARPAPECIPDFLEQAIRAQPQIDTLVNNAGTYCDLPFLEMDWEIYQRTMNLNVATGYFLTQAFARRWVDAGTAGRVLFTGSINGFLSEADHSAYDASKGAVAALVRSLCVALAPCGIRVNAMAPGLVRTPLTQAAIAGDVDAWMRLHTPNGCVPGAEVCGGAAVFLLSDAAEHIHGQTLLVDGGMSAWQQPDLPEPLRGKLGFL